MNDKFRNPAYILLQFRDGTASNWQSLCEAVGIHSYAGSAAYILEKELDSLVDAGLLVLEEGKPFTSATIKLSSNWSKIQTALKISLKELATVDPYRGIVVAPFFGRPSKLGKGEFYDLFVLMPFNDDLKPVYEDHIKGVATSLNLCVKRADDFFTADAVMGNVWSAIYASRLVIADCTGRNPNVFYEIGLAHAIGKPVILIAQNNDDVPFDLRHIRYIQYKLTPRGMKEFEAALAKTINYELEPQT